MVLCSSALIFFQAKVEKQNARNNKERTQKWGNSTKHHWDRAFASKKAQWKIIEASDWYDKGEYPCQPLFVNVDWVKRQFLTSVSDNVYKFKIFDSENTYAGTNQKYTPNNKKAANKC